MSVFLTSPTDLLDFRFSLPQGRVNVSLDPCDKKVTALCRILTTQGTVSSSFEFLAVLALCRLWYTRAFHSNESTLWVDTYVFLLPEIYSCSYLSKFQWYTVVMKDWPSVYEGLSICLCIFSLPFCLKASTINSNETTKDFYCHLIRQQSRR